MYYCVILFLVVPLLMFLVKNQFQYNIYSGLLIIVITPTAIASPVMSDLIGAKTEKITAHVALINIISPITFGLLFVLFFPSSTFQLPFYQVISRIAFLIIIPLLLAKLVSTKLNKLKKLKLKLLKKSLFILLVFTAASNASPALRSLGFTKALPLFLTTLILAVLLYSIGFLTGKNIDEKKTHALMLGHKNIGLSLWIVLSNFGEMESITLVLYIISHHVVNGFLISIFGQKK
jgi:predicted Na+-dependent transporter